MGWVGCLPIEGPLLKDHRSPKKTHGPSASTFGVPCAWSYSQTTGQSTCYTIPGQPYASFPCHGRIFLHPSIHPSIHPTGGATEKKNKPASHGHHPKAHPHDHNHHHHHQQKERRGVADHLCRLLLLGGWAGQCLGDAARHAARAPLRGPPARGRPPLSAATTTTTTTNTPAHADAISTVRTPHSAIAMDNGFRLFPPQRKRHLSRPGGDHCHFLGRLWAPPPVALRGVDQRRTLSRGGRDGPGTRPCCRTARHARTGRAGVGLLPADERARVQDQAGLSADARRLWQRGGAKSGSCV